MLEKEDQNEKFEGRDPESTFLYNKDYISD